jgi:GH24 family phage-related lysozyme (muramidase)
MNIDKLKGMLKRHEGFRNVVYLDNANPPKHTICWGRNIDANPLPADIQAYLDANGHLLPEHCERLLDADIATAYTACKKLYPKFDTFSDNRQDALIDMMFNMGASTLRKFVHANYYVNSGDWEAAAMEFLHSTWATQVHGRATELIEMIKTG